MKRKLFIVIYLKKKKLYSTFRYLAFQRLVKTFVFRTGAQIDILKHSKSSN